MTRPGKVQDAPLAEDPDVMLWQASFCCVNCVSQKDDRTVAAHMKAVLAVQELHVQFAEHAAGVAPVLQLRNTSQVASAAVWSLARHVKASALVTCCQRGR